MGFDSLSVVEAPRVDEAMVRQLRAHLRGDVLVPGEDGYDAARRIWNGAIDHKPALIIRAAGISDALAAVDVAGTYELPFSVKGGGHGVAGYAVADGGLVLDLSGLKGIRVDPVAGRARVEAGLRYGELVKETQIFSLATPGGKLPNAGVAGTTLGGGIGWLLGKYGLGIDNLLGADIITADGRFLTTSEDEHPDLFWALRGGGGNFGIVTSLEFQLQPVGPIYAGTVAYPLAAAKDVLRFYREFAASAPDDLTMVAGLFSGPGGAKMIAIAASYLGLISDGERVLRPLQTAAAPVMTNLRPMPYFDLVRMLADTAPAGIYRSLRSNFLGGLSDDLIETIVAGFGAAPSAHSAVLVEQFGGAAARIASDATAFPHRDAAFNLMIDAGWVENRETETNQQWLADLWEAVQPELQGGAYVNFLDQEGSNRVKAAYGPNYARLLDVKRQYDPGNFFRFNQNINPLG
jgi:FAD/FMN-containing dehydrogenase